MMTSASCSMLPDSRRSLMRGRWPSRPSDWRLSWERAITGTLSSPATALDARPESLIWRVRAPRAGCSRKRGVAHRRTRGDDHHFPVLEAVEHVVELEVAGHDPATALVLDHLVDFGREVADFGDLAAHLLLGDLEDALLGLVEHHVRLLV